MTGHPQRVMYWSTKMLAVPVAVDEGVREHEDVKAAARGEWQWPGEVDADGDTGAV